MPISPFRGSPWGTCRQLPAPRGLRAPTCSRRFRCWCRERPRNKVTVHWTCSIGFVWHHFQQSTLCGCASTNHTEILIQQGCTSTTGTSAKEDLFTALMAVKWISRTKFMAQKLLFNTISTALPSHNEGQVWARTRNTCLNLNNETLVRLTRQSQMQMHRQMAPLDPDGNGSF